MHLETTSPGFVFLAALWKVPSLLGQLLGHRANVVGLESAASADVADAKVIALAGVLVHVPSCADARLQTW